MAERRPSGNFAIGDECASELTNEINIAGTINCPLLLWATWGLGKTSSWAREKCQYGWFVRWNSMNIRGRLENVIAVPFCFHRSRISVSIPSEKTVIGREVDTFCQARRPRPVCLRYRPGCGLGV